MQQAIERVRGFHDVDPTAYRRNAAALVQLVETFRLWGYAMIDVPIMEQLELYLRKNGAQTISKLYSFADQGRREVALRPEFTASIIRAFAPEMASRREPLRVAYTGPVFRYEKPQRATLRQFTQAGVELLGEEAAAADAEIVALACRSAIELGVARPRLVIGHLGPLRALLRHLNVDGYAEGYLLEHIEYYHRGSEQREAVRRRLGSLDRGGDDAAGIEGGLAGAVHEATPEQARAMVGSLLQDMGIELTGSTRSPDEIIDRLRVKARRQAEMRAGGRREGIERALSFLEELHSLRGAPSDILPQTERLLADYDVPGETLRDVYDVVAVLGDYGLSGVTVELAPGMARGIAYYSGLIFELYADPADDAPDAAPLQICGGGRYDGLSRAVTGRSGFPALGFAFGVERLVHALRPEPPVDAPRIAIAPADDACRPMAQRLAAALRADGLAAVVQALDTDGRRLADRARRAGYAALLFLQSGDDAQAVEMQVFTRDARGAALRQTLAGALARLGLIGAQAAVAGAP